MKVNQHKDLGRFQGAIWTIYVLSAMLLLLTALGFSVDRPVDITLEINGDVQTISTSTQTIEELFEELDITYTRHDELSHPIKSEIVDDMKVSLQEAVQVVMNVYGEEQQRWTTADTIAGLMNETGIELQGGDVVTPGLHLGIEDQLSIKVAHYETQFVNEEYTRAYETEHTADASIYEGNEEEVTAGQEAEGLYTYKVIYKNGQEVERQFVDHKLIQEQQNKIIAVGTKPKPPPPPPRQTVAAATSPQPSANVDAGAGRTMTVRSTAYTAYCNGCSGVTYTGIDLRSNPNQKVIAVDPNVIPLGSIVEVEGYGRAIAGDIGSAIQGHKIDLYMQTREEALRWGRRTVTIRIIE